MADVAKLKKARRLGPPPTAEEASSNLAAPESAPAAPTPPSEYRRRDMRSARKTNRVVPFATRVSPEYDERIRDIADRDGLKLVEVMELALDAYEAQRRA